MKVIKVNAYNPVVKHNVELSTASIIARLWTTTSFLAKATSTST